MTGNQLRTYRIQAGLLSSMLAKRLGVALSTVSKAESYGDREFSSKRLRAAMKRTNRVFENWTEFRDGPRSQRPHMAKRGEGAVRDKTNPKTAPSPPVKKQRKVTQAQLVIPRDADDKAKLGNTSTPPMGLGERNARAMAKTLGWETGRPEGSASPEGHNPYGPVTRLHREDSAAPESTHNRVKTAREAAIARHGGCTACGGAPKTSQGSYSPSWDQVVICDKCGYAAISLWKWCERTGAERPPMEKPPLGDPPEFSKPQEPRSERCRRCNGSGRDEFDHVACLVCEGKGHIPRPKPTSQGERMFGNMNPGGPTPPPYASVTFPPDGRVKTFDEVYPERKPNFQAMTFEQGEEIIKQLTRLADAWEKS